jgi:hypothetical protein
MADGDYVRARQLLTPELRDALSTAALRREFEALFAGDTSNMPKRVECQDEFVLEDWPSKQPGDVGWAYVSIIGGNAVEAVSVTVTARKGRLLVRRIEWRRP